MEPNSEKTTESLLGFLDLQKTPNQEGYLGAILITDLLGIPQEFRCTHPVKPTTIQKPLYGEALEPHIGVKLCGIPLIESVRNKPSLMIVSKEFLLGVRSQSRCAVVFIRRAGEALEIAVPGTEGSLSRRSRIDSATGRFQPIIISPHSNFDIDVDYARDILEKAFNYLDPLEPFERIAKAVELIGKHDKRFQS
jgi:hypothetical protein